MVVQEFLKAISTTWGWLHACCEEVGLVRNSNSSKNKQVIIVLLTTPIFHFVQLIDCSTYKVHKCTTPSNCQFFLPAHFFYPCVSIVSRVRALLHSTLKFIVETGCWQMAPLRFSLPTLIGFWGAKLQLDSICLPKKKLRGKCLFSAPQALPCESRVGFL